MSQSPAASSTETATTDAETGVSERADETPADVDTTDLLTLDAPQYLQVTSSPAVNGCLLPISSPSPKRPCQALSTPICNRKIEVRSDSGGDIGGGGY
jgi:proliferating cell nuclear antigen